MPRGKDDIEGVDGVVVNVVFVKFKCYTADRDYAVVTGREGLKDFDATEDKGSVDCKSASF